MAAFAPAICVFTDDVDLELVVPPVQMPALEATPLSSGSTPDGCASLIL
jgi:hypothetical protein